MRALALCALLAATTPVAAAEWAQQAGSTLRFATAYDGEAIDGAFARFRTTLDFDPAHPGDARLDVTIDLASAGTGHDERDEVLHGADFFDADGTATARYSATGFRALGDGRYVADGTLALRGRSREVPLRFSWTGGATPRLVGEATVPRLAFGVGGGEDWADVAVLPDEVAVRVDVVFAPAQPRKARTAPASNGQSSSAPESSRRSTGMRVP